MANTVNLILTLLCLIMVNNQRSFVDTAPTLAALSSGSPEVVPQYQDDSVVRDLEDLKNTLGKSLEVVKTHSEVFSNVNGHQEAHSDTKEQLHENGKLVASIGQELEEAPGPDGTPISKLRTKVDIPSKGIHKTIDQPLNAKMLEGTDNGNRRANSFEYVPINRDNLPAGFIMPKIISNMHPPPYKFKTNVCRMVK